MKRKLGNVALTIGVVLALALALVAYVESQTAYQRMGMTGFTGLSVSQPTAVGSATPVLMVDSTGLSNLVEVRDSVPPVFTINDGGVVVGKLLQYGSSGERVVCGTDTVTGTLAVSHGLTTPSYAVCDLAADPTGDAQSCSYAISGITVTLKVWQSALTPAANTAGHSVHWCVVGTP